MMSDIQSLYISIYKSIETVLMMDILTLGWWLIIKMVWGCYLYYLFYLTIKDSWSLQENKLEHPSPLDLLVDGLVVAGGLWLWSHVVFCIVGFVVCFIASARIAEMRKYTYPDLSELKFYSNVYLGIRLITGFVWLWDHKIVLFAFIFALILYVIVIIVLGRYRKKEVIYTSSSTAYASLPLTTAPMCHDLPVPNNCNEGAVYSRQSDISIKLGSRQSLWRLLTGQNVNVGDGVQTIGEVTYSLRLDVHSCRDVIITPPVSSIHSRNKMAQRIRKMIKKLKKWIICM